MKKEKFKVEEYDSTRYDPLSYNALDWDEVWAFVKGKDPKEVYVGFDEDWTGSKKRIYTRKNGKLKRKHLPFVVSYWATPVFMATMDGGKVAKFLCVREATADEERKENARRRKERARFGRLPLL